VEPAEIKSLTKEGTRDESVVGVRASIKNCFPGSEKGKHCGLLDWKNSLRLSGGGEKKNEERGVGVRSRGKE